MKLKLKKGIGSWPLHVFLVAVYPVLYLYGENIHEASWQALPIPLLATLGLALFFFLIFLKTFKNPLRAALALAALLVLFFSYGRLGEVGNFFPFLMKHRCRLVFFALMSVGAVVLAKRIRDSRLLTATRALNQITFFLVLISLVQILIGETRKFGRIEPATMGEMQDRKFFSGENSGLKPDIYYVILDGYARADVLKDIYGFDNGGFIDQLKELGFYVPSRSFSNYPFTYLSLASSLNMNYLDENLKDISDNSKTIKMMTNFIANDKVSHLLQERGYQFIQLASGWSVTTNNPRADLIYGHWTLRFPKRWQQVDNFVLTLLQTTALGPFATAQTFLDPHRVEKNFISFKEIPSDDKPKFVFCHVLAPHPPFMVDSNGRAIKQLLMGSRQWEPKSQYVDQLIFVNKQVLLTVKNLLQKSKRPPLIILQSDHGPAATLRPGDWDKPTPLQVKERMANFEAIYFPGSGREQLYNSLSPVNIFRIVFNTYFGSHYPLLEDRAYFCGLDSLFQLKVVANRIP